MSKSLIDNKTAISLLRATAAIYIFDSEGRHLIPRERMKEALEENHDNTEHTISFEANILTFWE